MTCLKVVTALALIGATAIIGCGGNGPATVVDDRNGLSQDGLKAGECIDEESDTPQGATPDELKLKALATCDALGLDVSNLTYGSPVATGGVSGAKWSCCKADPKPVDPPKPGPQACFVDSQGGPTSCKPSSTWKVAADTECRAKGADLTKIEYVDACGNDEYRFTKFECCSAAPPPPPPPACFDGILGDTKNNPSTTCEDPLKWIADAKEACAKAGQTYVKGEKGDACPGGVSTFKYECCGPAQPPPPPPAKK